MKKILVGFFMASIAVASIPLFSAKVSADGGSYNVSKSTKNGLLILSDKGTWSDNAWNSLVWGDCKKNVNGESHLYWYGSTPFNADNIIVTNTISVDKVLGSFSAGVSGGTDGVGANLGISVSSTDSSQSYSYSVSNKWQNNVYYEYNAKVGGLWLTADFSYETSAVTQLGSDFYRQTTGQISI